MSLNILQVTSQSRLQLGGICARETACSGRNSFLRKRWKPETPGRDVSHEAISFRILFFCQCAKSSFRHGACSVSYATRESLHFVTAISYLMPLGKLPSLYKPWFSCETSGIKTCHWVWWPALLTVLFDDYVLWAVRFYTCSGSNWSSMEGLLHAFF